MPVAKKCISILLCAVLVLIMYPSFALAKGASAAAASSAARAASTSKAITKPITKPPVQIRTNLIQTKGFQQICKDNQRIPHINTNKQNRTSLFNNDHYPYYVTPPYIYYWPIFIPIDNDKDEDEEDS